MKTYKEFLNEDEDQVAILRTYNNPKVISNLETTVDEKGNILKVGDKIDIDGEIATISEIVILDEKYGRYNYKKVIRIWCADYRVAYDSDNQKNWINPKWVIKVD